MVRRTGGALRRAGSFVIRRSGGALRRAGSTDSGVALSNAAKELPGGAAAAIVYRLLKGRVASPWAKAGIIAGAAVLTSAVRPVRMLSRGMAGAATFIAVTNLLPE